ncbi:hypothetical protein ISCGN_032125 [Ixodes scapularis]
MQDLTKDSNWLGDSLAKEEHIARLESCRREQNQRSKGRRRANATDDDRATEAKRKRKARRRQHSTPADQFQGATARFRREFVENPFAVTYAVCDRLWLAGDVSTIGGVSNEKKRETDSLAKEEHIARLESCRREQNQRCKGRRRANATDDDRATEAKRKRKARRRQHSTPAEQFPGATARFRREFVENPFAVTYAVCDRLWLAGDVSTIGGVSNEKKRETDRRRKTRCGRAVSVIVAKSLRAPEVMMYPAGAPRDRIQEEVLAVDTSLRADAGEEATPSPVFALQKWKESRLLACPPLSSSPLALSPVPIVVLGLLGMSAWASPGTCFGGRERGRK